MIRPATHDDIPRLLEMGAKFAEKARLNDHVGYDPDSMAKTFAAMIDGDAYCLFIGESGAIGGARAPHPFNYAQTITDELFWWSEGREGLRLLAEYEKWAQGSVIRMTALEEVDPERVERLLTAKGYKRLERSFVKVAT